MLAWGLWAVFARLATDSVLLETAMGISDATGTLVAGTYIVATRKIPTAMVDDGLFYAALAGIAVVFPEETMQTTDTAGILLTGSAIALIAN
ncbi:hypothetical protein [Natrialba sp. PRR66]|uniref:hypothetical protein n=1 Tax=Natrialba sp. PRR66 TaxID=3098146 RepID=UPI002B1D89EC|nr:hypothetical protein [Natrialba sp. PRR66]